jgi:ribosomal subunit interface protein
MKIVIKSTKLKLTPSLKDYIEEKINSLEKFSSFFKNKNYYNHFFGKGKPKIEAWVEVGKESLHHKKGPFFWAECQMRFPGKSLRAEARAENLKIAISEVKNELKRQIKEYKEKIATKIKSGQRTLKKKLKIAKEATLAEKKK